MINRDFCLSSYIAFRYIWKDDMDFADGMRHDLIAAIPASERIAVATAQEIDREIQRQFDELYAHYPNIGILLSGGMDSTPTPLQRLAPASLMPIRSEPLTIARSLACSITWWRSHLMTTRHSPLS